MGTISWHADEIMINLSPMSAPKTERVRGRELSETYPDMVPIELTALTTQQLVHVAIGPFAESTGYYNRET